MPLKIIREDITKIRCDAIVNPSNEALSPDGGTDAAIHKAAGPALLSAVREIGGVKTGDAVYTEGYALPARYVIHTAGPVYVDGESGEEALLRASYRSSLTLARTLGCESVAFPLISSGLYGFPKEQVLKIAMDEIGQFLFENEMTVYIAVFDKTAYALSRRLFDSVCAYIDEAYVEAHQDAYASWSEEENYRRYAASLVRPQRRVAPLAEAYCASVRDEGDLDALLRDMDDSFAVALLKLIDMRGMDDVECYKKANVSKQTWHKILNDKNYKPSKSTVLSFAVSLHLSLKETLSLLETVGYTLSKSSKFDVIVSYFISHEKYDIYEIDETLFHFDQPTLASYR